MLSTRIQNLQTNQVFDVLIIGAGINGAVSAARLSHAGYRVALIDKNDFASSTSQQSSNLVWGGIKYMENYEFSLVRHLCVSRNRMLKAYPSQVKEIRFLATHNTKDPYPLSIYWLGTWLYWLLGSGHTQKPKRYSLKKLQTIASHINTTSSDGAIEYSDSFLPDNDARFVYRFIHNAKENGAVVVNYCKAEKSIKENNSFQVTCTDQITQQQFIVQSKVILNCAGPYADEVNQQNNIQTQNRHILSKGVHLIVPRIQKEDHVLAFLSDDKRPFFVIPMKFCSCIGTTDTPTENPLEPITEKDRNFVLENINKRIHLTQPLTAKDIIGERCGVRPLVQKKGTSAKGDWFSTSRKHQVEADPINKSITVFGGKLTDCINVADEVYTIVNQWVQAPKPYSSKWYGDPEASIKKQHTQTIAALLSNEEAERLWSRYDVRIQKIPEILKKYNRAQQKILPQAEYYFYDFLLMAETEDIVKPEDLLRRRTELALTIKKEELQNCIALQEIFQLIFKDNFQSLWNEYFRVNHHENK